MRYHNQYLAAICPWPTRVSLEAREHPIAVRREWLLHDIIREDRNA